MGKPFAAAFSFTGLKIAACAHLAALALQPILAGQIFGSLPDAVAIHGMVGETAAWLALAQAGFALASWFCKVLNPWASGAFVAIFALDGLQVHAGHAKALPLHIPLGAGLLAVSLVLTLWLLRRTASAGSIKHA
jgi:hypothetical protein